MKCDLHCHTKYSYDSNASIKDVVDEAIKRGVDCLAITDHGTIDGAKEALEYAKDKPILIVLGIEITSNSGDILGLNINKVIPNKLSAIETINQIHQAGGFAIIPHPFETFRGFNFGSQKQKILEKIDAIEINSFVSTKNNKKAISLAKEYNLPITCGSDSHELKSVGKIYLELNDNNLTIEEIFKKIKGKEYKINTNYFNFFQRNLFLVKRGIYIFKNLIF